VRKVWKSGDERDAGARHRRRTRTSTCTTLPRIPKSTRISCVDADAQSDTPCECICGSLRWVFVRPGQVVVDSWRPIAVAATVLESPTPEADRGPELTLDIKCRESSSNMTE
jgi:hypothetical protein